MSSISVTASATVSRPVDHVWAVLADHEAMSSWGPGLRVSLDETGDPDRNGLGAVRRIVVPGPAPAIVEEIVAFEPGRRLGYRARSGVPFRDYAGEVLLAADGSGTRIEYSVSVDPRIPVIERAAAAVVARVLLTGLVRAARR